MPGDSLPHLINIRVHVVDRWDERDADVSCDAFLESFLVGRQLERLIVKLAWNLCGLPLSSLALHSLSAMDSLQWLTLSGFPRLFADSDVAVAAAVLGKMWHKLFHLSLRDSRLSGHTLQSVLAACPHLRHFQHSGIEDDFSMQPILSTALSLSACPRLQRVAQIPLPPDREQACAVSPCVEWLQLSLLPCQFVPIAVWVMLVDLRLDDVRFHLPALHMWVCLLAAAPRLQLFTHGITGEAKSTYISVCITRQLTVHLPFAVETMGGLSEMAQQLIRAVHHTAQQHCTWRDADEIGAHLVDAIAIGVQRCTGMALRASVERERPVGMSAAA